MTYDKILSDLNRYIKAIKKEFPATAMMITALRDTVELHKPEDAIMQSWFKAFNNKSVSACRSCNQIYPCETIETIKRSL